MRHVMIQDIDDLEDRLSEPTDSVIKSLGRLEGDILVLGIGGKMGPSLSRMAVRASEIAEVKRRVVGVSRFSDAALREQLHGWGIETIAGDLLDTNFVESLPDMPNIIYMAGKKFGTVDAEADTWAANTYLPSLVCQRFPKSRIAAFSTGNVYGAVPINKPSTESSPLNPLGDYSMSCLGRERIFEYFSRTQGTPVSLLRLNYAADMRYGVLVDLGQLVYAEKKVPLDVGYANTIWQGDANAMALCTLADASSPPFIVNITAPEKFSFRDVAMRFGELMNKRVYFSGIEGPTALHCDGSLGFERYGLPKVKLDELITWVADWIMRGGQLLGKPTHYEVADGKY